MPSTILSDNGVSSGTSGIKTTGSNDGALALQTTTAGGTATTALSIDTSQNVSFVNNITVNGNNISADNSLGFRNRIINGDMRIDQRYAGTATANTINGYAVDRWSVSQSTSGKIIAQQNAGSVTPPTGFANYLGITSQSAYSVGSGDYYLIGQAIEGYNIADLEWGTANAKTVTVSFWVRSSLTGTFGGSFGNNGTARSYLFTYTISAANTWEYKTVTIAGDTSGTWEKTTSTGLNVRFGLGVGSTYSGTAGSWSGSTYFSATGATSVVGTNGATFYITGVQLEVGSVATPFERRPYGTELNLCQRYYYKIKGSGTGYTLLGWGWNTTTTESRVNTPFKVPMRIRPTALEQSGTASDYDINYGVTTTNCSAVPAYRNGTSSEIGSTAFTVGSGLTAGEGSAGASTNNNTNAFLAWSAEL